MNIKLTVDRSGPLEPDALLGDVRIESDGSSLFETDTYLDSWISALISGWQALSSGREVVELDLNEEPNPLVFSKQGRGVRISYKDREVSIPEASELEEALREATFRMLGELDSVVSQCGEWVSQARRFLEMTA